ncbi:TPA: polyhydroxyalkanoate biosynthesis repressor PhaR, partial [Campylobacter jejuni]|nr:polyhydroxyalkanoate biosynthesis repressor PhaR [Campylobacter jejuni]
MKEIKIQNIIISEEKAPLVVPEIGINHNGSLELAKIMV